MKRLGGNKKKGKRGKGRGAGEDGWRGRKGGEEEVGSKMNNRTSFGRASSELTLIFGSQCEEKCVALKDPL